LDCFNTLIPEQTSIHHQRSLDSFHVKRNKREVSDHESLCLASEQWYCKQREHPCINANIQPHPKPDGSRRLDRQPQEQPNQKRSLQGVIVTRKGQPSDEQERGAPADHQSAVQGAFPVYEYLAWYRQGFESNEHIKHVRHTLGMRLISDDVPLDVISRLMGHTSLRMTERYARKRLAQIRAELERVHRKRKTVNYQGQIVKGDPRANDLDTQMVRKGIRGQTLAVGGCGRLVVLGPCNYANKCLTCPMWLTSTDDVPALKSFYVRAIRLRQRAVETRNQTVITQQDHIITNLAVRIKSLEEDDADGQLGVDDLLAQLRVDLAEAISGWEEAKEAGLLLAAKHLERTTIDLKAKIEALEGAQ